MLKNSKFKEMLLLLVVLLMPITAKSELGERLTRLEEKIIALEGRIDIYREADYEARNLVSSEIARRLEHLNGETGRAAILNASKVDRDLHDAQLKEIDKRFLAIEGDYRELMGKLWLPMLAVGAVGSAAGAAAARYIPRSRNGVS